MDNKYKYSIRLLLIGDQSVGKSSMLLRYGSDKFSSQQLTTIGVDLFLKNLPKKSVQLEVYDSSGQNRYQSIIKPFYRTVDGIILVYDVTEYKSFENLKKWVKIIDTYCRNENVKLFVVGNKRDLKDYRVVMKEDGQKFAKKIKAPFFETSAKSGKGVRKLFSYAVQEVVKSCCQSYYYKKNSIYVKNEINEKMVKNKSRLSKIFCGCLHAT